MLDRDSSSVERSAALRSARDDTVDGDGEQVDRRYPRLSRAASLLNEASCSSLTSSPWYRSPAVLMSRSVVGVKRGSDFGNSDGVVIRYSGRQAASFCIPALLRCAHISCHVDVLSSQCPQSKSTSRPAGHSPRCVRISCSEARIAAQGIHIMAKRN